MHVVFVLFDNKFNCANFLCVFLNFSQPLQDNFRHYFGVLCAIFLVVSSCWVGDEFIDVWLLLHWFGTVQISFRTRVVLVEFLCLFFWVRFGFFNFVLCAFFVVFGRGCERPAWTYFSCFVLVTHCIISFSWFNDLVLCFFGVCFEFLRFHPFFLIDFGISILMHMCTCCWHDLSGWFFCLFCCSCLLYWCIRVLTWVSQAFVCVFERFFNFVCILHNMVVFFGHPPKLESNGCYSLSSESLPRGWRPWEPRSVVGIGDMYPLGDPLTFTVIKNGEPIRLDTNAPNPDALTDGCFFSSTNLHKHSTPHTHLPTYFTCYHSIVICHPFCHLFIPLGQPYTNLSPLKWVFSLHMQQLLHAVVS